MKRKCLAIGIILLFIGTSIVPAIAKDIEKSQLAPRGEWLYVGGSGPGNYSRIQDAINDSKDGDTIYVYDDSSPYTEYLLINKSINLFGENKYSTIIKGNNKIKQHIIQLTADGITLQGFTIQDSAFEIGASYYGIALFSNNNDIFGNILRHNVGCILISHASRNTIHENIMTNGTFYCHAIRMEYSRYNEVYENSISGVFYGVDMLDSAFNKVHGNSFTQIQSFGVHLVHSYSNYPTVSNHIYKNYISGSENGIDIAYCTWNFIYLNEITSCKYGFYRISSSSVFIIKNNFINNSCNAYFYDRDFMNKWIRNYWDDWKGFGFYTIQGITTNIYDPEGDPVSIIQYDIHPARKPYDI